QARSARLPVVASLAARRTHRGQRPPRLQERANAIRPSVVAPGMIGGAGAHACTGVMVVEQPPHNLHAFGGRGETGHRLWRIMVVHAGITLWHDTGPGTTGIEQSVTGVVRCDGAGGDGNYDTGAAVDRSRRLTPDRRVGAPLPMTPAATVDMDTRILGKLVQHGGAVAAELAGVAKKDHVGACVRGRQ